mmetsp:Transcript_38713/g.82205  ORF Transcript_38713/g.82205 Transcript_38713/m.82205 type:complete len:261 (+) Transcript_38713:3-785(+)
MCVLARDLTSDLGVRRGSLAAGVALRAGPHELAVHAVRERAAAHAEGVIVELEVVVWALVAAIAMAAPGVTLGSRPLVATNRGPLRVDHVVDTSRSIQAALARRVRAVPICASDAGLQVAAHVDAPAVEVRVEVPVRLRVAASTHCSDASVAVGGVCARDWVVGVLKVIATTVARDVVASISVFRLALVLLDCGGATDDTIIPPIGLAGRSQATVRRTSALGASPSAALDHVTSVATGEGPDQVILQVAADAVRDVVAKF